MRTLFNYLSIIIIFSFLVCFVISCEKDDYDFTYETIITESPVNLEELNSVYDDYNSTLPYEGFRQGICFSTNRNSFGENYDLIFKDIDFSYHSRDDIYNISFVSAENSYNAFENVLDEVNSESDELGPYAFEGTANYNYLFYATNDLGNFDINYVSSMRGDRSDYNAPKSFASLNSEFDDLYPFISEDEIYFCSNRENNVFNIYTAHFNENEIMPGLEVLGNNSIELNGVLSSDKDDKCPYLYDDLLVFTSDRIGGKGGFDLYYSKKIDGIWSAPQNFGNEINSEWDEYRPIVVPFNDRNTNEHVLIFSSDRMGGKGGFDLYAVRVNL